jgi:hypothetical protein
MTSGGPPAVLHSLPSAATERTQILAALEQTG